MEHQSARIKNIEQSLTDVVAGKFDAIINVGVKLNDNIVRLVKLTERGLRSKTEERRFEDGEKILKAENNRTTQQLGRVNVIGNLNSMTLPVENRSSKIYRLVK